VYLHVDKALHWKWTPGRSGELFKFFEILHFFISKNLNNLDGKEGWPAQSGEESELVPIWSGKGKAHGCLRRQK